jgi:hypothetical protein
LQRAGLLAVVAPVAVLATACGIVHVHFGSGSTGSVTIQPNAAFVQCVRSHGVPSFPDSTKSVTVQLTGNGPIARAYEDCKHLLG